MKQEGRKGQILSILVTATLIAFWAALGGALSSSLQGFFSAISHSSSWVVGLAAVILTGMLFGALSLVMLAFMWLRSRSPTVLMLALFGMALGSLLGAHFDRKAGGKGKGLFSGLSQDVLNRLAVSTSKLTQERIQTQMDSSKPSVQVDLPEQPADRDKK